MDKKMSFNWTTLPTWKHSIKGQLHVGRNWGNIALCIKGTVLIKLSEVLFLSFRNIFAHATKYSDR